MDYAAQIGLGQTSYDLIDIEESAGIGQPAVQPENGRFNVFTTEGTKVLTNAKSLSPLAPGVYIINGRKTRID